MIGKEKNYQWKVWGNFLHKIFKIVVKKLNNSLPSLGWLGFEVSNFTPEPNNFAEVYILPAEVKKAWLKENFKETKNIINNQTFLNGQPKKGRYSDTMHVCLQGQDTIWWDSW